MIVLEMGTSPSWLVWSVLIAKNGEADGCIQDEKVEILPETGQLRARKLGV